MREIKFRAWNKAHKRFAPEKDDYTITMNGVVKDYPPGDMTWDRWEDARDIVIMQFTGLKDKNGVEIYEGDIVGEESVYHFLEREGWKAESGAWKIIGEKVKDFTGKGEEKYIAGYRLAVVEWRDSSCGFEPFSDSEENCGHCGAGKRSGDMEVIGNIYENPELLGAEL